MMNLKQQDKRNLVFTLIAKKKLLYLYNQYNILFNYKIKLEK